MSALRWHQGWAAPLFGAGRDVFGSYVRSLYIASAALVTVEVLVLALGKYPKDIGVSPTP